MLHKNLFVASKKVGTAIIFSRVGEFVVEVECFSGVFAWFASALWVCLYRTVPVHCTAIRHTCSDLLQHWTYAVRSTCNGRAQCAAVPQNNDEESLVAARR